MAAATNGPSGGEHPLEQPWQLYLHFPTFTQSIESYASEAYQASGSDGMVWCVVFVGFGLGAGGWGLLSPVGYVRTSTIPQLNRPHPPN